MFTFECSSFAAFKVDFCIGSFYTLSICSWIYDNYICLCAFVSIFMQKCSFFFACIVNMMDFTHSLVFWFDTDSPKLYRFREWIRQKNKLITVWRGKYSIIWVGHNVKIDWFSYLWSMVEYLFSLVNSNYCFHPSDLKKSSTIDESKWYLNCVNSIFCIF